MKRSSPNRRDAAPAGRDSHDDRGAAAAAFPAERPPADRAADLQWLLLGAGIIVLAVLWIYAPVYHGDWLWDDDQLLTTNATVQSKSLAGLTKLWLDPDGADYFPLSYSFLWAQWPFFGLQSTGYHVTSILLHALSALLVWALFAQLRIPAAFLGGLLFAIHPVCVESVSWVSEIKNTLSMPFFLLSCICWVMQDDAAESAPVRSRTGLLYLMSVVFFLVAMFAKTSMVALPVVLLVHAWWKRGRITQDDLTKTAPFFLISLLLGLITIYYQHGRAIGTEKMPVESLFTPAGFLQRTAVVGMAIFFYLSKVIAPVGLLPIYPRWEAPQAWQFLAWPAMFAAIPWIRENVGTAVRPGWGRHVAFGLGFFLLMVAPVLGFVTISYMRITWVADHFIYLPMLGVIALLVGGAGAWYDSSDEQRRPWLIGGAATMFAVLAFSAHVYAMAWRDEDALWSHTLRTNESAWQAHNRLGARKFARNDVEGAHYHFTRSTALRPDLGETHNNLGTTLSRKGQLDEAIKEFAEARRLTPQVMQMNVNLVNALMMTGRKEEAEQALRKSIEFFKKDAADPKSVAARNDPGGHRKSAHLLSTLGRHEAAVSELLVALEKQPEEIDVHMQLATAQQAAGKYADAVTTFENAARRFAPRGLRREQAALIEQKIADCKVAAGRPAEAVQHYQRLLATYGRNPVLWNNMAVALYALGRRAESVQAFEKALAIAPGMKDAVDGLAKAKAEESAGTTPKASAIVPVTPEAEPPFGQPPTAVPASPTLAPRIE
jgi:protein O-mannosyl-transferase